MSLDIATLTESDKGREVRYDSRANRIEYGRITSWNERFVFVRYHVIIENSHSRARYGDTSEATDPNDLEFTQ